ncbi:secretory immunoglobulin A-binding protein EsiB-like [Polypterus senegalus]|uniref:secretory immunoglobulin A-binding protein EsiB-like n=1 Tax=Polypterus senegalus TaxID=55291 RepID=UPI00196507CC|nr:secretory immunoglobulin A-binding protein EsiB-like [Polypterus senegalus]
MRRSSRSASFQDKTSTDRRPHARSRSGPSELSWSACELLVVTLALLALFYVGVHHHNFHLHVTRLYAALGHPQAQHLLGQRYLTGVGVEKDSQRAMEWFRRAAEQGHPHSAYNLALGVLRNLTATQQSSEAQRFLLHAAANGISEAYSVLEQLASDPEYS